MEDMKTLPYKLVLIWDGQKVFGSDCSNNSVMYLYLHGGQKR